MALSILWLLTLAITGNQKRCSWSVAEAAPLLVVRVDGIVSQYPILGLSRFGFIYTPSASMNIDEYMKTTYTQEYKIMLDWLINQRHISGISQQSLAESLGKPQSFVSKFENGERRIDFIEFINICRVIDCDPIELITALYKKEK